MGEVTLSHPLSFMQVSSVVKRQSIKDSESLPDFRPLFVPLAAVVYNWMLPYLSTVRYYGETFAFPTPIDGVPVSISHYICTIPASLTFLLVNLPVLAYMWTSQLSKKWIGANFTTVSLVLFNIFFLLF